MKSMKENIVETSNEINVTLPLLKLYPQQQRIYDMILSNRKKFVALCCHRRLKP